MTSFKIALAAVGVVGGVTSTVTGTIVANVPAIGSDTPINLTLALVGGGIAGTAVAAWKVSRAWSAMENRMTRMEEKLVNIESRCIAFHAPQQLPPK